MKKDVRWVIQSLIKHDVSHSIGIKSILFWFVLVFKFNSEVCNSDTMRTDKKKWFSKHGQSNRKPRPPTRTIGWAKWHISTPVLRDLLYSCFCTWKWDKGEKSILTSTKLHTLALRIKFDHVNVFYVDMCVRHAVFQSQTCVFPAQVLPMRRHVCFNSHCYRFIMYFSILFYMYLINNIKCLVSVSWLDEKRSSCCFTWIIVLFAH